jgi:hypothetical protein
MAIRVICKPSRTLDSKYVLYLHTNSVRRAIFTMVGPMQLWIALEYLVCERTTR